MIAAAPSTMHKRGANDNHAYGSVNRAQSTLSVSAVDYYLNLPGGGPPSPTMSTVTLTPGRIRNIDQDMEALKASRADNPFIQQVIASRESLADCLDEVESDDANLMSQEFAADSDVDPLALPEVHEHMIRSPPPVNWPRSPNHRFFQFPSVEDETLHVEVLSKEKGKDKHWATGEHLPVRGAYQKSYQDRFSILTPSSLRSGEDSIRLMSTDE